MNTNALRQNWMLVLLLVPLMPMWRMGFLRDDWLLYWKAVDPGSAPVGAGGVFSRPVAELLWQAAAVAGDSAALAMHLLVVVLWAVLCAGLLHLARYFGVRAVFSLGFVVLYAASHGALTEPRLWAAASNGVAASALGVWGAVLLTEPARIWRVVLGLLLIGLGIGARADAVLWLIPPAIVFAGRRSNRFALVAVVAVTFTGLAAFTAMVASSGAPTVDLAVGGRLLRLTVLPWGPQLPGMIVSVLTAIGLLGLLLAALRFWRAHPEFASLLLMTAAVAGAGSLSGWSGAGRYVIVPVCFSAIVFAKMLASVPMSNVGNALAVLLVLVHLTGALLGSTTRDLLQRSSNETELYRFVQDLDMGEANTIDLENAPIMGWKNCAADIENVVSTARRKPIDVVDQNGEIELQWNGQAWSRQN